MVWSFSFQLMPDEELIDDSTGRAEHSMIKPAYSVFLTNKRAIFRFDSLGSSLTQSFAYPEILEVRPRTKLFIKYLELKTKKKEYLLNVIDAEYWAEKILEIKATVKAAQQAAPSARRFCSSDMKKRDFLDMLTILRKNSLLTEEEFAEKVQLLDSLKV